MDEKTLQALTLLANKLGTTVEYLWEVLVKQAYITGGISLVTMIVCNIVFVVWLRFVLKKVKAPTDDKYAYAEWKEEGAFFAWVSVFVTGAIALFVNVFNIQTVITTLLNPEFWALKQVLKYVTN